MLIERQKRESVGNRGTIRRSTCDTGGSVGGTDVGADGPRCEARPGDQSSGRATGAVVGCAARCSDGHFGGTNAHE